MATAKKLPSGNYRVQYYVEGKSFSVTRPTARGAELAALEHQERNKQPDIQENITLRQAIDEYIALKSNTLSPSTIRGYRKIQNNSLSDILDYPLKKITVKTVQMQMNKNAKHYSPKSIRNQFGLIRSATKSYKLDLSDVALIPKEKIEYHIPTPEEQSAILDAVSGTGELELWVMFIMLLGLRPSEAKALDWKNYNGETIYIKGAVVQNEYNEYIVKKQNKTFAGTRKLDVPKALCSKLDIIRSDSGQIFTKTPTAYYKAFKRCTQCIGEGKFNIYSLRHAYASTLLLLGVPDKYAMERMGHSTNHMLKTVYQHTFKNEQKEVSNKLDEYFKNLSNKNK